MPLVRPEGARVRAEERLQAFERLEQRIGLSRSGWRLLAAEPTSHRIKSASHTSDDPISRLQGKRQTQRFRRGLERCAAEQGPQQRPQERRIERVPWQYAREEKREGFPAATAFSTVRAEHPLAPHERTVRYRRIIAAQHAVAVERAATSAMRTTTRLERKSTALNAS
jgi:hypothetical protein